MRLLVRVLLLSAALLLAAAPFAEATAPQTMSYQGVLTDAGGNLVPDGPYNLTFRIYDAPAAGTVLWTEVHNNVPVANGGFSVILGSTTPITVPFTDQRYLGTQVGANPELTPRATLACAPNSMGVTMRGSSPFKVGEVGWIPVTTGFGDGGGFLHLWAESNGYTQFVLEPDFNGDGGYLAAVGANNSNMIWDGNPGGTGSLYVNGGLSSFALVTGAAGDDAVLFPSSSISSDEILDEPGISGNHVLGSLDIVSNSSAGLTDIVSTTITIPAPGYIVVEADAQFGIYESGQLGYQISETAGAARNGSYYFYVGNTGITSFGYYPASARRVFYKASPGSYTFYFQAYRAAEGPSGFAHYAWNPTITAQYFPTSYGTVTAVVAADEASAFEHATPVAASTSPRQPGASDGMVVDLRELERQVRRDQARLAESQQRLLQARARTQLDTRTAAARPAAAPAPSDPSPREER